MSLEKAQNAPELLKIPLLSGKSGFYTKVTLTQHTAPRQECEAIRIPGNVVERISAEEVRISSTGRSV